MRKEERRIKLSLYHGCEFMLESVDNKLVIAKLNMETYQFEVTSGKSAGRKIDVDLFLEHFKMVMIPLSKLKPEDLNLFSKPTPDDSVESLTRAAIRLVTNLAKDKYDIFDFIKSGEAKEM